MTTDTAERPTPGRQYIVVWDDDMGVCAPMSWDDDCSGALCALIHAPIALFDSRAAARQAIRVSTAYAKLRLAQGQPANTDFTDGLSSIKVLECKKAP